MQNDLNRIPNRIGALFIAILAGLGAVIVAVIAALARVIHRITRVICTITVVLWDGLKYFCLHIVFEPCIYTPYYLIKTANKFFLISYTFYWASYIALVPFPKCPTLENMNTLIAMFWLGWYQLKCVLWLLLGFFLPEPFDFSFWEVVVFPNIGYDPKTGKKLPGTRGDGDQGRGGPPRGKGPRRPDTGPAGSSGLPVLAPRGRGPKGGGWSENPPPPTLSPCF